eukprot:TRINITY_DN754_c0_g1_i10.p1 TRINITY_DN754_c0_g1~~TRINITY_DN754_c0_g1_i10.p1  ORF type:complete len:419 (+),score=96.57 TRINITY_DN754_c0_g1_i10:56-1312(+)
MSTQQGGGDTPLDDEATALDFVNVVNIKGKLKLNKKAIVSHAKAFTDAGFDTVDTIRCLNNTYEKWKASCAEMGMNYAFRLAGAEVLGLQKGTTPGTRKEASIEGYKNMAQAAVAPDVRTEKRVGRVEFDDEIRRAIDGITATDKRERITKILNLQATRSLVLLNASGVGKTYAATTARTGQQHLETDEGDLAYELVTAYVGFNSDFDLQPGDSVDLEQAKTSAMQEKCVRELIARRLLAVVRGLVNAADEDLRNLDTENGVQKCSLPSEFWGSFVKSVDFAISEEQARDELEEQLKHLKTLSQDKMLVLLVAVDEAQELDRLVAPDQQEGTGGARFALRYLRVLQQDCYNATSVLVLPMAIGLNPEVSLGPQTTGKNIVLEGEGVVMLTHEDFKTLALDLLHRAPETEYHAYFQALF